MRLSLACCALIAGPALAVAQAPHEPPPPPYQPSQVVQQPGPPPPERTVAVTISPVHLLFPIVEVTAELRVGPRLGVAAIVGAGALEVRSAAGEDLSFTAGELGASVRYYVTGSFRQGVQVGGEVMYLYVKLDDTTQGVQATGDGLSLGPFVGYKWTGRGGFTAEAQLGLLVTAIRAHADDGATSATEEKSRAYPLLNANLGWSF